MSSSFGCAGEHLRKECTDTFIENAFYLYRVENNDQQHPTHNIQRRRHCRRSSLASKLCCDITADAPKCRAIMMMIMETASASPIREITEYRTSIPIAREAFRGMRGHSTGTGTKMNAFFLPVAHVYVRVRVRDDNRDC